MTDTADVLDLIDAAVEDWETSWPDAVRYNAEAPKLKRTGARLFIGDREIPITDIQIEEQWSPGARMIRAAADFEQRMLALTGEERDEFVAYWQASPWSMEQAWSNWVVRRTMETTRVVLTARIEPFIRAMTSAAESLSLLLKSFARKPCGARECFCHPAPFPAARDYRRRTKHRNRRRR